MNSRRLVELIVQNSNGNTRYEPTKEDVLGYLSRHVKPGDLVVTMGAGDIWKVADALAKQIRDGNPAST